MFRDMLHTTLDKSVLRGKPDKLGEGGFGKVYRVKLYKVINSDSMCLILELIL